MRISHNLEYNIRRVIADILPQMLEKVSENWTSRLDYIRASRGSPMPEIIFKISKSLDCAYLKKALLRMLTQIIEFAAYPYAATFGNKFKSDRSEEESEIVYFSRIHRIKCIVRMDEDRSTKKSLKRPNNLPTKKGQTKKEDGLIDDLEKDLLVLRTKNWRTLAGRRLAWKRLLEKAKAHSGLSRH
ncbi:hypothetical protein TNCV_1795231 [Trichonephila clavipes]|nr:hypothetical protein TNCV_1795231 [Trichonephila clavipes]